MDKELQTQLASVLSLIKDGILSSKDFAMEQLPDIAQQYIVFNRVYLTFLVIVLVGVIFFVIKFGLNYEKTANGADVGSGLGIAILVSIVPGFLIIMNLKEFFMVWFAPKIFLIQTISGMITK